MRLSQQDGRPIQTRPVPPGVLQIQPGQNPPRSRTPPYRRCRGWAQLRFSGLRIRYDCGIGFRPGTRFGPRDIRAYSVRYSAWGGHGPSGYWDVNQRKRFLKGIRMVDCGDVDIAYYDFEINRRKMTSSVEAILDR